MRPDRIAIALALLWACTPSQPPTLLVSGDRVVARHDGPAASLAQTKDRVVIAYTEERDAGRIVFSQTLEGTPPFQLRPRPLSTGGRQHPNPPLAMQDGNAITVLWRETSHGVSGRILWSESPAPKVPFASSSRPLPASFDSRPRGGGKPATFIALQGDRPPRSEDDRALGIWQRDGTESSGWVEIAEPQVGDPLGYAAIGVGPGLAVTAVLGSNDTTRQLTLGRRGGVEPPRAGVFASQPVGPAPVWLAMAASSVLAAWSERVPGPHATVAVLLAQSRDGGRTWPPPRALMRARDALHPLASFDEQSGRVVAAWRQNQAGEERIMLVSSADGGASFSTPRAIDDGRPGIERTRPRLALRDDRVLVAWEERKRGEPGRIVAALIAKPNATMTRQTFAKAAPDRDARHPQPWLLDNGTAGVVWESRAAPRLTRTSLPSAAKELPRVSLHLGLLR